MITYNVQSNGVSHQLIIEVTNDIVFIEPSAVAYVIGNLTLNASATFNQKLKAIFIGKKYIKPSYEGSGKIYLKATLGSYHKITLRKDEELTLMPNAFIACSSSVTIEPYISFSMINFISGLPTVKMIAKGRGVIMVLMPGPIVEYELKNTKDKFVAYSSDIAAYSNKLNLTRNFAGKGWLNISKRMVQIFRGNGKIYFSPNPNKGAKRK